MRNLIVHYFNNLIGYAIFSTAAGIIIGCIRWGLRWLSISRDKVPFEISDFFETMMWTDFVLLACVFIIIGINLMIDDSDTKGVIRKIKEELL